MIRALFHDQNKRQTIYLALLSVATVTALFQVQGHLGFSLSDEGFLWYGSQRVMLGEVPIRDFMAYDPGRYYWSAAIMSLLGDNGIVANRIAAAMFQAGGLFLCLWLLRQNAQPIGLVALFLAVGTLVVWMYPRHKLFDITLSIALVAILTFFLQQPSRQRFFLTGVVVGFVAVFGRNHAVYGAFGSIGALIYLRMERCFPMFLIDLLWWIAGVITGYLPIFLFFIVFPGFAQAFVQNLRFLFEYKGTNLPLPIPWPWRVDYRQDWPDVAKGVLVGSLFVAVLVFGIVGLGLLIRSRIKNRDISPVYVASVLLALPYAHFTYSRADVNHLAQGIFPFLIGILFFLVGATSRVGKSGGSILFAASVIVMLPQHPIWQFHRAGDWQNVYIAGDNLTVEPDTATDLALLAKLVERYAPDGQVFIAMPLWPGAYAAFLRKSPMWEIYPLFPRSAAFQEREIQRIKRANPGFALVIDHPLDGREELRFRNTHPLIDRYIKMNYDPLDHLDKRAGFQIYVNNRRGQ
jgi:hypothetical protein